LEAFLQQQPYLSLPEKSGVYIFKDAENSVIYVGKAINLKRRVKSYFKPLGDLGQKVASIKHIVVESEIEALVLESFLIKKYKPKYNHLLKDDKSYLYINFTDEKLPRIMAARKDLGGFGPFPRSQSVRSVLKYLRKIFPYRSCRVLPKKTCLYFDLGLCLGVCEYQNPENIRQYRKNLKYLKDIFQANNKKVVNNLETEMQLASSTQNFEKAAQIRNQLISLEYLRQKTHLPTEYFENPNLYYEIRNKEKTDLKEILGLKKEPVTIEGYDISNISGKNATGSMVTFVNGDPDKTKYRRFKIRFFNNPNDVGMMREILLRRFKHSEWASPDLILIDGGKGQVEGVKRILEELGVSVPVIGLAKKMEKIVTKNNIFQEIQLASDALALNLLKRIRDESHRFAKAYHVKLRKLI
jgi:excinuclease ABC subunit C